MDKPWGMIKEINAAEVPTGRSNKWYPLALDVAKRIVQTRPAAPWKFLLRIGRRARPPRWRSARHSSITRAYPSSNCGSATAASCLSC